MDRALIGAADCHREHHQSVPPPPRRVRYVRRERCDVQQTAWSRTQTISQLLYESTKKSETRDVICVPTDWADFRLWPDVSYSERSLKNQWDVFSSLIKWQTAQIWTSEDECGQTCELSQEVSVNKSDDLYERNESPFRHEANFWQHIQLANTDSMLALQHVVSEVVSMSWN